LKIKLCRKIGFVESSLMIGGHVLALFLTTHPDSHHNPHTAKI
jgi:hypothetical protein